MDHWFDSLTKGLASAQPSRRSLIAGVGVALAAGGTKWDLARGAAPSRPAHPSTATKTATFGPCTVLSQGGHFEHHLVSRASSNGHNAELHRTRTIDPKTGTTHDTTVLVDGKQQLQVTSTFTRSSQTHRFIFGNALIPGGAVLTTDGKTLRGTIGGKTIVPYTIGSGRKLQFVNGTPKRGSTTPGVSDAIEAVAKQADADLERCTASDTQAFVPNETHLAKMAGYSAEITSKCGGYPNETLFQTSGSRTAPDLTCGEYYLLLGLANHNGVMQGQATTNTWFSKLCEACNNKCGGNLFTEIGNVIGCVVSAYTTYCADGCISCGKAVTYSSDQFNCQQGCQSSKACDPVPCGGESCLRDQICVYGGNANETFGSTGFIPPICCPKTHPKPCGRPGGAYAVGLSQPWIGGYCCGDEAPCIYDTRFGPQSSSFNDNGYYCCPKAQICGSFKNGVYVGVCCFPKQHCCNGGCCGPLQGCAKLAGYDGSFTGAGSSTGCCPQVHIHDGKCCPGGHWCGPNKEYCCQDGCAGGKCAQICLTGQRTRNGTCCGNNIACGDACCENGCADAKTSKCKPKSAKCSAGQYECDFYPKGYLGKETICCPKGRACYEKCCPPKTVACANLKGVWGCWPQMQCAPTPPPPK